MSYKKVYFRTDGSLEIGLGHIYRCMALAEMLKNDFEISFYTTTDYKVFKQINHSRFPQITLNTDTHFNDFLKLLEGNEIVVLDNYFFEEQYMNSIKEKGSLLVCIDDIADRKFNCDIILNHGPGIDKNIYKAKKDTKFLLGLDYALLRPHFLNQKRLLKDFKKDVFFICFGGSDFKCLTSKTLNFLNNNYPEATLNIVIGGKYTDQETLNELIAVSPHKINLFSGINEKKIINLLHTSNYGIVACSSILIEALSSQLPCIGIKYVDNQHILFDFMSNNEKRGVYINSETEKLTINHIYELKSKVHTESDLIDLKSGKRILNAFLELRNGHILNLRQALEEDAMTYFNWVNEPNVRENSFQSETIELEEHLNWFNKRIRSLTSFFFIAEISYKPCGQIRFDVEDNLAYVDISIDSNYRGQRIAPTIIQKGIKEFRKASPEKEYQIIAEIKISNKKSINSFKGVNFVETNRKTVNGTETVVLTYQLT